MEIIFQEDEEVEKTLTQMSIFKCVFFSFAFLVICIFVCMHERAVCCSPFIVQAFMFADFIYSHIFILRLGCRCGC